MADDWALKWNAHNLWCARWPLAPVAQKHRAPVGDPNRAAQLCGYDAFLACERQALSVGERLRPWEIKTVEAPAWFIDWRANRPQVSPLVNTLVDPPRRENSTSAISG